MDVNGVIKLRPGEETGRRLAEYKGVIPILPEENFIQRFIQRSEDRECSTKDLRTKERT